MSFLRSSLAAIAAGLTALLAAPAIAQSPWQKITNPGPVIGANGTTYRATCSAYPGTDPTFSFWARKGSSKNLAVVFEGGGACWDSLTCTFPIAAGLPSQVPQFFVPQVAPGTDPAAFNGLFADRADNPVRDWSMVYIPYCTGDLHGGSATRTYANVGHPVFPLPSTFDIQHRGFDNFMVVLDWMKKNMDGAPKNLLVTGPSAGGYGASLNFPWLARAYPNAHMFVLADASQGVTTPAFDLGNPGRAAWNLQFAPGAFGADPASVSGPDLLRKATEAFPNAKVAQFTTAFDAVQIGFYGVMKQYYGPGPSCTNVGLDWYQQMVSKLQSDAAEVRNFRFYLAAGSYHTLVRSPLFYTEASAGPTFNTWLGDMLANRGGAGGNGGGWDSVACPTCIQPPTCF
jgi:hypothetical protein